MKSLLLLPILLLLVVALAGFAVNRSRRRLQRKRHLATDGDNAMEGDLRLVDNDQLSTTQGILQVYHNGIWGTVCDDNFNNTQASVVCRQLGISGSGYAITSFSQISEQFGLGRGPIWLDDVDCTGSEQRLIDCNHPGFGIENCRHEEDVGIVCLDGTFDDGDIQLVNGITSNMGRIQIIHDGIWGTICNDEFDILDVQVACRQLGYTSGFAVTSYDPYRGGVDPTWLDDLACVGTESKLADCPNPGWGVENCGHGEDVGIVCLDENDYQDGDIILVNSPTPNQGLVQIYHDGIWGTICNDEFNSTDANVVCRQLGYQNGLAMTSDSYGVGIGQIWLDDVACTGTESRLADCPNPGWGVENCGHGEDIAVFCYDETFVDGDLLLANGPAPNEGRIQVFHDGVWGTVCNDEFDNVDAIVACRQLGYQSGYASSPRYSYGLGIADDPIWLDDLACIGTESRLSDCPNPGWGVENCGHGEDVSVYCYEEAFVEGDIQLANGTSGPHEGRLQVYHDNVWGTVCNDEFGTSDANVACRQLGYEGGFVFEKKFGFGADPIWLDDLACTGNEDRLVDCPNPGWGVENCGHGEDISLSCYPMNPSPSGAATYSDGDILLAGADRPNEGIVLYRNQGLWGGICTTDLTQSTMEVMCRELGYEGGYLGGLPFDARDLRDGVELIWIGDARCTGNEERIADCPISFSNVVSCEANGGLPAVVKCDLKNIPLSSQPPGPSPTPVLPSDPTTNSPPAGGRSPTPPSGASNTPPAGSPTDTPPTTSNTPGVIFESSGSGSKPGSFFFLVFAALLVIASLLQYNM